MDSTRVFLATTPRFQWEEKEKVSLWQATPEVGITKTVCGTRFNGGRQSVTVHALSVMRLRLL